MTEDNSGGTRTKPNGGLKQGYHEGNGGKNGRNEAKNPTERKTMLIIGGRGIKPNGAKNYAYHEGLEKLCSTIRAKVETVPRGFYPPGELWREGNMRLHYFPGWGWVAGALFVSVLWATNARS